MRVHPWFLNVIAALYTAALLVSAQCAVPGDTGPTLSKDRVRGASVYIISVDLNDPSLTVDIGLPLLGISHSETFGSFVKRHAPLVAVTGTYFDMRTLAPTGSIVTGGKVVHLSHIGTAVCFMSDNKVKFVEGKFGEACDLTGAQCGLRTGPRLIAGGHYALDPRREGFRHPGLFGARTRMALGVTTGNRLLLVYVGTPVNFSRLASIMKTVGAADAVCLDGGTSSAMYFEGQMVHRPGRMLTNLIEVYRRPLPLQPTKQATVHGPALPTVMQWRADSAAALGDAPRDRKPGITYDQLAVMSDSIKLRLTKSVHTLFPINRA